MEIKAKASRRGFTAGAKYAMHAPYRDLKRGTVEGRRLSYLSYFTLGVVEQILYGCCWGRLFNTAMLGGLPHFIVRLHDDPRKICIMPL